MRGRVRTPSVRAGVGMHVGMLLLGFVLVNAVESAAEHPNASTTSQARLLSSTVVLEYECGDLKTCAYLNDGQCDDGGPSANYWECPRFSDATDCGTLCDQHAGSLPPPPPSCEHKQWASNAESSSYFNEHYTASQAGLTLALTATAPTDLRTPSSTPHRWVHSTVRILRLQARTGFCLSDSYPARVHRRRPARRRTRSPARRPQRGR